MSQSPWRVPAVRASELVPVGVLGPLRARMAHSPARPAGLVQVGANALCCRGPGAAYNPSGAATLAAQARHSLYIWTFGEHEGGCCGGPAPLPQPQRVLPLRKLKPQARPVCGLHSGKARPLRRCLWALLPAGPPGGLALSSTPPCSEPLLTLQISPSDGKILNFGQVKQL